MFFLGVKVPCYQSRLSPNGTILLSFYAGLHPEIVLPAGLNVLALVNSHAAAALQYGIERDFTNKTEWVVLYDMGATSTEAALVKYSSFSIKEFGKPKTFR